MSEARSKKHVVQKKELSFSSDSLVASLRFTISIGNNTKIGLNRKKDGKPTHVAAGGYTASKRFGTQ